MSLKAISTALSTHLSQMPNLPPVAWENGPTFNSPQNDIYLAEYTLPAGVVDQGLAYDSYSYEPGVYQVSVFAPRASNKFDCMAMADAIRSHFSRGLELAKDDVTVKIARTEATQPLQQADRYQQVVTIRYTTFV